MAKGKTKKIPERMCVNCRQMKEKQELFRIVRLEDGPVLDSTGKLAGRGAYLCKNVLCVDEAVEKNKLKYHLKSEVPKHLVEELHTILEQRDKKQKTIRIDKYGQKKVIEREDG